MNFYYSRTLPIFSHTKASSYFGEGCMILFQPIEKTREINAVEYHRPSVADNTNSYS